MNVDGSWCYNLALIKNAALDHFSNKFKERTEPIPWFRIPLFRNLSTLNAVFLESEISMDEEVEAVASSITCSHDSLPFMYLGLPASDCCFYGGDGGISSLASSTGGYGVWHGIIKAISKIESGIRLMDRFPRLYALDMFQDCKVSGMWVLENNNWCGRWAWKIPLHGMILLLLF
ncbi:hypothetical protein Tco_0162785 [Tanacetum coccineum]